MRVKKYRLRKLLAVELFAFSCSLAYSDWRIPSNNSQMPTPLKQDSVCYVKRNGSILGYFVSLSGAMKYCYQNNENDSIYVIPGGTNACNTITIENETLNIEAGDSLILPHTGEYWGDTQSSNDQNNSNASVSFGNSTYKKIQLNLVNTTINVNGLLGVGGLWGGLSSKKHGFTGGNYSEIIMDSSSKLNIYGNMRVYGYIGKSTNFTSTISINVYSGGSVSEPLVVYDFEGGTNTVTGLMGKAFFFNCYDMPSIEVPMLLNYGSTLVGKAAIYMSDAHRYTDGTIFSTSSAAFLTANSSDASLLWDYNRNSTSYAHTNYLNHKTTLTTYGNITFNKLVVSIFFLINYTVDSSDYFLPVSSMYSFIVNGTLNINNKIQFLPGASVKINETGFVYINANVVAHENNNLTIAEHNVSSTRAEIINNGTIVLNSGFQGYIQPENSDYTSMVVTGGNYSSSVSTCNVKTGGKEYEAVSFSSIIKEETSDTNLQTNSYYTSNASLTNSFYRLYGGQTASITFNTIEETGDFYYSPVFYVDVSFSSSELTFSYVVTSPTTLYLPIGSSYSIYKDDDDITVNRIILGSTQLDLLNPTSQTLSNTITADVYPTFERESTPIKSITLYSNDVPSGNLSSDGGQLFSIFITTDPSDLSNSKYNNFSWTVSNATTPAVADFTSEAIPIVVEKNSTPFISTSRNVKIKLSVFDFKSGNIISSNEFSKRQDGWR